MGRRLRRYPGSSTKYPGTGYRKLVCDVCGFYVRRMDAELVDDPLAYKQQGLMVCKWCKDEYNPQLKTKTVADKVLTEPETVRTDLTVDEGG